MSTPSHSSGLSPWKKTGIAALAAGAIASPLVVPACREKVSGKFNHIMDKEDRPIDRGELTGYEETQQIEREEGVKLLKDMLKSVENTRSSHDSDTVSAFHQLQEFIRTSAKGLGDNNQLSFILDDGDGNGVSYSINAVDDDKITIKYRGFGKISVDSSFTLVKHDTNNTIYRQNPNKKGEKSKITWEEIRDAIKKMIPLETASYNVDPQTGYYTLEEDFFKKFNNVT